jgi:restriction endonuclease EcoRV
VRVTFKDVFLATLKAKPGECTICGAVTTAGVVYPLGSDTKVLSTVFELITRPLVYEVGEEMGLKVIEPAVQNHYPDFTLCTGPDCRRKIAIDVKTTYVTDPEKPFRFTLGG